MLSFQCRSDIYEKFLAIYYFWKSVCRSAKIWEMSVHKIIIGITKKSLKNHKASQYPKQIARICCHTFSFCVWWNDKSISIAIAILMHIYCIYAVRIPIFASNEDEPLSDIFDAQNNTYGIPMAFKKEYKMQRKQEHYANNNNCTECTLHI